MSTGDKCLVIGISGVTCGGKTSLANELKKRFPTAVTVSQDDYFLSVDDPRHEWIPRLNHINFDVLTSLDMAKMFEDIKTLQIDAPKLLILEGFCIFNYPPIEQLCELKFYFTLPKEECERRRTKRVYDPPDCDGYFELCAWPEHVKQLKEVQANVKNVTYFDGNSTNVLELVSNSILTRL